MCGPEEVFLATIYDIAERAGVSTATVSRVLNGNGAVNAHMRELVMRVAADLQYIPNRSAKSLTTKRSAQIALIISDIMNPYFAEITRGAQDELEAHGYQLLLANSDDNQARELKAVYAFAETGVDGLLIAPAMPAGQDTATHLSAHQTLAQALERLHLPVVALAPEPVAAHADVVTINEVAAARLAVDHLLSLGRHSIALINGPAHSAVGERRARGYKHALTQHGLRMDPGLVIETVFKQDGGHEAMKELLHRRVMFDAVFAADDQIAIGALKALKEAGRFVPEDVAMVCVGGMQAVQETEPTITSISAPRGYEFGRVSAQLLMERLGSSALSGSWKPQRRILASTLTVRGSTAARLSPGSS